MKSLARLAAAALALSLVALGNAFGKDVAPAPKRLNNFTTLLLDVSPGRGAETFAFDRLDDGWIFISYTTRGAGTCDLTLDKDSPGESPIYPAPGDAPEHEAFHRVARGRHTLSVKTTGKLSVKHLIIKGVPELVYSGPGYEPKIKAFGPYDMNFLHREVLPNVTTLIIPSGFKLSNSFVVDWHRQGKRVLTEVGVNPEAKTAAEHAAYWTSFFTNAPFSDGIIIDEFIVNRPMSEWVAVMTPERKARVERERAAYEMYAEAFRQIHADNRFTNKTIVVYVGGSGKKLNQEIIGTNVIRALLDCGYTVAPERYLHEMSSEKGAQQALREYVEGLADWEAKEPGVKKQMMIAFGLFSMPFLTLNKLPGVDYHVWMDQQMNRTANDPSLVGVAGINWWTSLLADAETVQFLGKLYRHYAIEGKKDTLTHDPLFLNHIQNADFEHGTNHWTIHAAEDGSISPRSHPRYGRIEGRYMGLISPPDPEHIGDTFLCLKRSDKGPNTFSQTIEHLQPGRLYSFEMFVSDYNDLLHQTPRKVEDAHHIAHISIEGADVDPARSFSEVYASDSEPKVPLCITYYWKVFRARSATATLTVSDWPAAGQPAGPFGQEQSFNFVEIQPFQE